jgi:hypothetical protein
MWRRRPHIFNAIRTRRLEKGAGLDVRLGRNRAWVQNPTARNSGEGFDEESGNNCPDGALNLSFQIQGTNVPFTGKYTVSANCAGTASLTFSNGTAHFNIVVDSANRWDWIETDSGTTQSGYALSVGTATCSEAEIKGNWNWLQMNGYLTEAGPGAFIGMTEFNGTGGATFSDVTESINGEIVTNVSGTAKYTVSSNCTGTLEEVSGSHTSIAGTLIVVSNGQEILAIGTASGTVNIQTLVRVVN